MPKRTIRPGSIQMKIIALTLLFTLGAALIISINSIHTLFDRLERNTLQSAEYALQTAATAIERDIDEVDALANWCTYTATIRTYMLSDITIKSLLQTVYPTVSGKYNSMRTLAYIQRFLLVNDKGRMLMFGSNLAQTYTSDVESLRLLPGLGEGEEDIAWQSIEEDPLMLPTMTTAGIPITRTLTASGVSHTGRVYISVSPSLITTPLRDFTLAEGGRLYFLMGETVYAIDTGSLLPVSTLEELPTLTPHTAETLDPSTLLYRATIDGEQLLVVAYPLGVHDLYLIETIPSESMRRQLPTMLGSLLVSVFIIVALGMVLTVLLRHIVAKPILALQDRIEIVSRGDFTTDPRIEWNNELGDIGRGINSLSRNITVLMDKRIEDEKQKKDLEYQMLQNQINPHFIYNTLNSIKWMATIQHAPGIAEMVMALSRLMKSVSKGNERLVPLFEEFALLNDYFTIQQYRYGGTITLEVSYIENEHLTHVCLIPRFTLQPLVENAIFHGIEPKGCAGDITLEVRKDPATGDVLLYLTDNGVGMTQEQILKALQPPGPEEAAVKFRHVGVWNVHRRLQYSFGDAYGLSIRSTPGEGTTVIVRLPYEEEEEEMEEEKP